MLTGNVPSHIGNFTHLIRLDLSSNHIHGPIPSWLYNLSLNYLILSSNNLTGVVRLDLFGGVSNLYLSYNFFSSIIFPESGVSPNAIDLSYNHIHGTLPTTLPIDISFFLFSNNRLFGEIPASICDLYRIILLDLADNNFTGVLPPCFGNLSSTLGAVSLSGNNFTGKIPELIGDECRLYTIDFSSNSFEGPLPKSLAKCQLLNYANFGMNKIKDSFPSWLGSLPSLKVLMLHSNRFHGLIRASRNSTWFPSLKIIQLSTNNLRGPLPADCFVHWQAMKNPSTDDTEYPNPYVRMLSMAIVDKGIKRMLGTTLGYFTLVDFSSNHLSGNISESIGDNLLKLHTLNLSNNILSGPIPQSLQNLKNLEVLDMSRNRLSGEIPGVLTRITTLNHFNVSYNNLSGYIPQGNQFGTFDNSSYIGNPELCGSPLTKQCGNLPRFSPGPADNQKKSIQALGILWIAALAGMAGGFVTGIAMGHTFGDDLICLLEAKWRKYGTRAAA
ncbi:hypothetical protein MLD38_007161 [Melastoma candidum]|uniref:Uncharacterized protein n=1 Tax=Melastoma candidum TaxID=119954 RepID=A0ACB9RQ74_9MYRT|nr:hypothetical protein MLD38_007161 [Melastoma candidum]